MVYGCTILAVLTCSSISWGTLSNWSCPLFTALEKWIPIPTYKQKWATIYTDKTTRLTVILYFYKLVGHILHQLNLHLTTKSNLVWPFAMTTTLYHSWWQPLYHLPWQPLYHLPWQPLYYLPWQPLCTIYHGNHCTIYHGNHFVPFMMTTTVPFTMATTLYHLWWQPLCTIYDNNHFVPFTMATTVPFNLTARDHIPDFLIAHVQQICLFPGASCAYGWK